MEETKYTLAQPPVIECGETYIVKNPTPIPMDLESLKGQTPSAALASLRWPTAYTSYRSLTTGIVNDLLKQAAGSGLAERESAIVSSKTYDIVTDLAFIGRLSLDIYNAKTTNLALTYSSHSSPLLAYLIVGGDPQRVPIPRVWHHPTETRFIPKAKKFLHYLQSLAGTIFANSQRVDVINHNNLVDNFLQIKKLSFVDWPVTNYNWPVGASLPNNLKDVVAGQTAAFINSVQPFVNGGTILDHLEKLGRYLIEFHLAKAAADLTAAERFFRHRPLGEALLSGTPKHLGRLTGWLYQNLDKQVIRCAHGGERAFFDDHEWGLAEFTNCDVYYAHSIGEAEAIQNRLLRRGTAVTNQQKTLDVKTLGSAHHFHILSKSVGRGPRVHNNKVAYIAGGYLGEQLGDFPSRKPPDILYLDWQVHLLQSLNALGVEVIVKLHPAGVGESATFLSPYADRIVSGPFDPLQWDIDCFIFDFAGTAFFDAVATQTPIILADMTVRPFDESTKRDLATRCNIMPCLIDERGRFRVTTNNLTRALEAAPAISEFPTTFYDRYLGA